MKLIDINESQIKQLSKTALNLTHFWLLHLLFNNPDKSVPQIRERKLLEDRGLITKKGLTTAGITFYTQIRDTVLEIPKSKKDEKVVDNGFSEVWAAYPPSANFKYRGMEFKSDRALRGNKQVCEMLYNAAIARGEVSKEQIIKAIRYQVEEAKKQSFDTGVNRLQYLPGFEVYMRQEKYMSFIEVSEQEDEQPTDNCHWA